MTITPDCFSFRKSASDSTRPNNIRELDITSVFDLNKQTMKLDDYIKYSYIFQWSKPFQEERDKQLKLDLETRSRTLFNKVREYTGRGELGIALEFVQKNTDSNGKSFRSAHEVLAVGFEGNDLLIDDPNNTNALEKLHFSDSGEWSYSKTWTGKPVNSSNSELTWTELTKKPYQLLKTGKTVPNDNTTSDLVLPVIIGTQNNGAGLLCLNSNQAYVLGGKEIVSASTPAAGESDERLYWIDSKNFSIDGAKKAFSHVSYAKDNLMFEVEGTPLQKAEGTIQDRSGQLNLSGVSGKNFAASVTSFSNENKVQFKIDVKDHSSSFSLTKEPGKIKATGLTKGSIEIWKNGTKTDKKEVSSNGNALVISYDEGTGKILQTEAVRSRSMHRLYNPNSGEHFYTADTNEKNHLVKVGWKYEGEGWKAPEKSSIPVFRLYNPNTGDHHYTLNAKEKDHLVKVGWKYEGIGWYSDEAKGVPLYRQYNPNAKAGSHNYTASKNEKDGLVKLGWKAEGIGWYGMK